MSKEPETMQAKDESTENNQIEESKEKISWANDKLERQIDSKFLSKYLINKFNNEENATDSFVLNINADWGFGKTYFLENWNRDLKTDGYPVVFFNAWDSDYYEDPMIAFICEIKTQLKSYFANDKKTKTLFNKTMTKGFKLLRTGLPVIASILTKKITGYTFDQIVEIYQSSDKEDGISTQKREQNKKEIENAVSKIFVKSTADAIATYEQSKKNIKDFKDELTELIRQAKNTEGTKAPLFIFIDELDRCRPTYAIEVLEKIKHIFNVPGVYFIIATASEQLCHSIKSIYGQDFGAEGYLQRFFYQSYEFAEPDYFRFADYLFEKIKITNHFDKLFSPAVGGNDVNSNIKLFASYSELFDLGLRDQEQIAANLYTICLTWKKESPAKKIHLGLLLFLLIIRQKNNNGLEKILKEIDTSKNLPHLTVFDSLKKELFFDDIRLTDTFNSKPVTEKISNIIKKYINLLVSSSRNFTQISNQEKEINQFELSIHRQIIDELGRNESKDIDFHNFKNYFKIVKQIGQLK